MHALWQDWTEQSRGFELQNESLPTATRQLTGGSGPFKALPVSPGWQDAPGKERSPAHGLKSTPVQRAQTGLVARVGSRAGEARLGLYL